MPELPEVEALTRFLADKAAGTTIVRAEVAALSALKTFDPPVGALVGAAVLGCERRGKFVCLRTDGPWLVIHLARGGWVQWRDTVPPAKVKMGKGPLALRVGLSNGAGFDVTEAGNGKAPGPLAGRRSGRRRAARPPGARSARRRLRRGRPRSAARPARRAT